MSRASRLALAGRMAFGLAAAGLLLVGCVRKPVPPAVPAVSLAKATETVIAAYYKANPTFAANAGLHEFDGQLPDWSAAGLQAGMVELEQQRAMLAAYTDAQLSAAERVDRDHLLTVIDRDLFWQKIAEAPQTNPSYYLDTLSPSLYVARPYGTPEQRLRAFIAYTKSVVRAAPQIQANLRTPMPATFVKVGADGFGGLADFYRKDVPLAFNGVGDAALQAELQAAIGPAADAMQKLADWVKAQEQTATGPLPLGTERYNQMLQMTERVNLPVGEVERVGKADLERNLKALAAACAEFAPNATIAECARRVRDRKPAMANPVEAARGQLKMLRQFLVDKDVVTIPGTEQALVNESPPFNRQNFAYIDPPGPFEKNMPSVYYISPPDPSWPAQVQRDYLPGEYVLLATSVHEVWPGHFLQFLHANRAQSTVGRLFVGYAYAEGWAHYTEEMMWEQGLVGTPAAHIGQLLQALMRNCRLLSSIGLHTQGWKVEDSQRCFSEQAYADEGSARQQAARGTYDPAYLNYTLGKLMIMKLRKDWLAAPVAAGRPPRTLKDFHDQFLSYGGPPIPVVRKAMLGDADTGPVL